MPLRESDQPACEDCGASPATISLDGTDVCDRCFDRRIAAATGYLELPDSPAPVTRRGADGRSHRFRYRLWRAPTGVVAEAEESGVEPRDGFYAQVIGPHDVDIAMLLRRLDAQLADKLRRRDLEDGPNGPVMSGTTLHGRLEWTEGRRAYDVIVDGDRLSWDDFGGTLEPFEGYEFELTIKDMEQVGDLDLEGERDAPSRLD